MRTIDPRRSKIAFPSTDPDRWRSAMESSEVVDLPFKDSAGNIQRGKVIEVADFGRGIYQITAQLVLQ